MTTIALLGDGAIEQAKVAQMKKSEHYKPLNKRFNNSGVWVWLVQGVCIVYMLVILIMFYGKITLIDYWMVIDMLTTVALFSFYMYQKRLSSQQEEA